MNSSSSGNAYKNVLSKKVSTYFGAPKKEEIFCTAVANQSESTFLLHSLKSHSVRFL